MDKILELLESNARLSDAAIASMLDMSEEDVKKRISELESEKIVMGYQAIIDWEKASKEDVDAIIELKVTPERDRGFDRVAKRVAAFDEVKTVYLMSGSYDIYVRVEAKNMRDVANFVSAKLATIDGVISTATHFLLKRYKENGTLFEDDEFDDGRRSCL
ncbi:MAG: Lrp/AsnC family transcriptional regulator [Clostridiales bacterium]|nr:Lrp/AsnC family transcriptional regulator [Clostridiales bacterium]